MKVANVTGHPCHRWCVQVYGYFKFFFSFLFMLFWVILLAHSSSGRFINGNPLLWGEKLEGKQKADLMIKTLRNFIFTCRIPLIQLISLPTLFWSDYYMEKYWWLANYLSFLNGSWHGKILLILLTFIIDFTINLMNVRGRSLIHPISRVPKNYSIFGWWNNFLIEWQKEARPGPKMFFCRGLIFLGSIQEDPANFSHHTTQTSKHTPLQAKKWDQEKIKRTARTRILTLATKVKKKIYWYNTDTWRCISRISCRAYQDERNAMSELVLLTSHMIFIHWVFFFLNDWIYS